MAFSLQSDESIKAGFKRIAVEELNQAIQDIDDESIKRSEKVHRARRHGKQLRGLLRLASDGLGVQFRRQDRRIRDTSRQLSNLRDAKTMLDAYLGLLSIDKITPERLAEDDVLSELHRHRKGLLSDKKTMDEKLKTTRRRFQSILTHVNQWSLRGKGHRILQSGLCEIYRDSAKAMRIAIEDRSSTNFHEWRKYVKYHLHHCQIIAPVWPRLLSTRVEELDNLGDLLGEDHDLAILSDRVLAMQRSMGRIAIEHAMDAASTKRTALQAGAIAVGELLFAEKPDAFARRHVEYWNIWQKQR